MRRLNPTWPKRYGIVSNSCTPRSTEVWLNMAEIELNVLIKQCLDRRIDNRDQIQAEVGAWQKRRNNAKSRIDWQFTSPDARTKLKRLYPTLIV